MAVSRDMIRNPEHRKLFGFEFFNPVQSQCFNNIYNTNESFVVSAPTGAGKTVLFELAILRLLEQTSTLKPSEKLRVLCLCPTKALCSERVRDWTERMSHLALRCFELTSDTMEDRLALPTALAASDIIVATPEKLEMVTRMLGDDSVLSSSVGLVCIDEVHLLNLRCRGPVLVSCMNIVKNGAFWNEEIGCVLQEAVVARLKLMRALRFPSLSLRFVAVSATVTNINEIAKWLDGSCREFDSSYRPVPLVPHVLSYYKGNMNGFIFEQSLDKYLPELIKVYSDGRPSLVFCVTKKGCDGACEALLASDLQLVTTASQQRELQLLAKIMDAKHAKFLLRGICIHHSALTAKQRASVEYNFLKENIKVLCTTTTLAQGVNLPARLCLIKSTFAYKEGKYCEYDEIEMLQMIGRAGRPQFDSCGVAVIMTSQESYAKWNDLSSGRQLVTSKLQEGFVEHLNAEVALGTVQSADQAVLWFDSSFWGVQTSLDRITAAHECIVEALNKLVNLGLAAADSAGILRSTAVGAAVARYGTKLQTVSSFMLADLSGFERMPEDKLLRALMELVATAAEFEELAPRREHKKPLRDLGKRPSMKWPLKQCAINTKEKAFVLMQAAITGTRIDQWELESQKITSARIGGTLPFFRETRTEQRHRIQKESRGASMSAPLQSKSAAPTAGIGERVSSQLIQKGIGSLDELAGAQQEDLAECSHKSVKLDHLLSLQKTCAALPRYILNLKHSRDLAKITLLSFDLQQEGPMNSVPFQAAHISYQLVCYSESGAIQFSRRLVPASSRGQVELFFKIKNATAITCQVMCKEFVGLDITEEMAITDLAGPPPSADVSEIVQFQMPTATILKKDSRIHPSANRNKTTDANACNIQSISKWMDSFALPPPPTARQSDSNVQSETDESSGGPFLVRDVLLPSLSEERTVKDNAAAATQDIRCVPQPEAPSNGNAETSNTLGQADLGVPHWNAPKTVLPSSLRAFRTETYGEAPSKKRRRDVDSFLAALDI